MTDEHGAGAERAPERIPVATAKSVAEKHNLRQVLLIGFDGELVHVVTYGKTKADCEAAAKAQDFWTGKIREFSFAPNADLSRAPALADECERLRMALKFIQDISDEELEYAKVGTGAEVALRHINRRASAALSSTPAPKDKP